MKYLLGYPPELLARVNQLIAQGGLGESLRERYPDAHDVRTDPALYDYVAELKRRFLRNAPPLAKVVYDGRAQRPGHARQRVARAGNAATEQA